MKHPIGTAALVAALLLPAWGQAQHVQPIPDHIAEIRLENYVSLRVVQGDETCLVAEGEGREAGSVKGHRLTLDGRGQRALTLHLAPGRSMSFNTQDFSELTLVGDYRPMTGLELRAEDYSRIVYSGREGDTLRTASLGLLAGDFARIELQSPVQYADSRYQASGYSRIDLAAVDRALRLLPPGQDSASHSFAQSDHATIVTHRYTVDGQPAPVPHSVDVGGEGRDMADLVQEMGSAVRSMASAGRAKRRQHPWRPELTFAWGFHNWGSAIGNGFGGVENDASVRTTFNNLQLAFAMPVVNCRRFALYAGLGLEWDQYLFNGNHVAFIYTGNPPSFGADNYMFTQSRLLTRYVTLPLTVSFGNPRGWHLNLAAIAGLHWGGSHTGLVFSEVDDEYEMQLKDFRINHYINPYKLDVRLEVKYGTLGVYLQLSTLGALKHGCQELYPIKVGFVL